MIFSSTVTSVCFTVTDRQRQIYAKKNLILALKMFELKHKVDEGIGSPIFLTAGVFGVGAVGGVDFMTPPTYASPNLYSCLLVPVFVFLHFSLSVSDLASFLLSLFHSDSPDGKLISTV